MADLSHWFAQAYEYHDREGTFKVIYFQDRQELIAVGEELLRNGDSWSDDLCSSNMKSIVHRDQDTMPSPDIGSWQPYSPVPDGNPVPVPASVGAGDNGLKRFLNKELFDDLPTSSTVPKNDIPKASRALDLKLLGQEGGNIAPSSQIMATNSSKNDVQVAKEKEERIKFKKSIELGFWDYMKKSFKVLTRDRRVYSFEDYKTQDQHQDEGTSSLPKDLEQFSDYEDRLKDSRIPGYCKYALLFGIPAEFNPSGAWVIEELYNDMQESDF